MALDFAMHVKANDLKNRYKRAKGIELSDDEATDLITKHFDPLLGRVLIPGEAKQNLAAVKMHLKQLGAAFAISTFGIYTTSTSGPFGAWTILPSSYMWMGGLLWSLGLFFLISSQLLQYAENTLSDRAMYYVYPAWSVLALPSCMLILLAAPSLVSIATDQSSLPWSPPQISHVPWYYLLITIAFIALGSREDFESSIRENALYSTGFSMIFAAAGTYWVSLCASSFIIGRCIRAASRSRTPPPPR